MKFKPGDLVIKTTGGNKMRILSCWDKRVECVWWTESCHHCVFDEIDLIPYNQYEYLIKSEKRNDIINQILNDLP